MRIRSMAVLAVCVVASTVLTGCGPTDTPTGGGPTTGPARAPAPPATSSAAALPVKDLTPGNCTLYPKASAVALLGAVNNTNKALDIGTDGGVKIDTCSYLDLRGTSVEGISYAVVRYDSAATAFAEAQKVQTEMLGDAADHSWPVQSLTTPAAGAGPVLGGTGTKTEQGVTFTIAVVGTNVGPYLVAALGGSTVGTARAESFALAVFQALNTTVG
jgi:hypothetical protein